MISMEEDIDIEDNNKDDDQLYEVNTDEPRGYDIVVIDAIKKKIDKKVDKKQFSDGLMARYLQEMWDEIDSNEMGGFPWFSSEGTAPRSHFRLFSSDLRVEQEEVITYMDPDDLGFMMPSEGTSPRATYLKATVDDDNDGDDDDDLDDYNDPSIVSSPLKKNLIPERSISSDLVSLKKTELELKDRI